MIVRAICSIYDFPQLQKALGRSPCYSATGRLDLVPNPSMFPYRFKVDGHLTNDPTSLWKIALHDGFKGRWSYTQQAGSQLFGAGAATTVREQYIMFCFENETDMVYGRLIAHRDDIEDDIISFVYDNGQPDD